MSKTNNAERTHEPTEAELDTVHGGFASVEHATIGPLRIPTIHPAKVEPGSLKPSW